MSIDYWSVACPCCLAESGKPCVTDWICTSRKAALVRTTEELEALDIEIMAFPSSSQTRVLFYSEGQSAGELIFDSVKFNWRMLALALWRGSESEDGWDDEDFEGWLESLTKTGHAKLYFPIYKKV